MSLWGTDLFPSVCFSFKNLFPPRPKPILHLFAVNQISFAASPLPPVCNIHMQISFSLDRISCYSPFYFISPSSMLRTPFREIREIWQPWDISFCPLYFYSLRWSLSCKTNSLYHDLRNAPWQSSYQSLLNSFSQLFMLFITFTGFSLSLFRKSFLIFREFPFLQPTVLSFVYFSHFNLSLLQNFIR